MKLVLVFPLMLALYLAFAGQMSRDEWVAGAVSALAVTALSMVAHRERSLRFHFRLTVVIRQVIGAAPKLLTDTLAVIPRFVGGWHTGTMSQTFVRDGDADPAWWAVFILTTSLPPNSFVISHLPRPGEVIVHRLVPSDE